MERAKCHKFSFLVGANTLKPPSLLSPLSSLSLSPLKGKDYWTPREQKLQSSIHLWKFSYKWSWPSSLGNFHLGFCVKTKKTQKQREIVIFFPSWESMQKGKPRARMQKVQETQTSERLNSSEKPQINFSFWADGRWQMADGETWWGVIVTISPLGVTVSI